MVNFISKIYQPILYNLLIFGVRLQNLDAENSIFLLLLFLFRRLLSTIGIYLSLNLDLVSN